MNPRHSILLCASLFTFLFAGNSFAQQLEEIHVTATRSGTQESEVVESVSVVDATDLAAGQPALITDALQGAPGVFVQQTTPGQGTAIVRGLKGSEILHLVDGMRLNNALFRNAPNQYLALVSPWIIERAEVVRGPLSALYGSDAMGGVVQLLTQRRRFDSNHWQQEFKGRIAYDGASDGQIFNSALAVGHSGFSMGATASYQDFDDVRGADDQVFAPSAFRSESASFYTLIEDSEDRLWDFSVQYLKQPSTSRHDELVAGFGQTEPASVQFQFQPNSRLFVHGKHRSSGYGLWFDTIEVHVGYQKMIDGRLTQDTGSTSIRTEDNQSELLGLTFQAEAGYLGPHKLSYGLDAYHDEVSSSRRQLELSTGVESTVQSRFPDGSTLTNIDAYIHDQITLSGRTLLSVGARASHAAVDLAATESTAQTDISNTDFSGSVGVLFNLTDRYEITANLARGFRSPNIFDLGTLGARPGNRFNIANTTLGPETVLTGELGVRMNSAVHSMALVVWASDYDDKIISVFTGNVDASGRDIVQSQNSSTVKLHGLEISGKWQPDEHWKTDVTINFTRGDITADSGDEEPADRVPPLNGRLRARYELKRWTLGGELLFAAEQDRLNSRDISDPRINPLGTPGWGSFNVLMTFAASEHWTLNARLENLFDQDYRRHGSGINSPGQHLKLSVQGVF